MGAKEQGANATEGRWIVIPRTLCFVRHGDDILLLKRAPHKRVFPNRYNGLGGHIERNESPLAGAIREIKEESGIDVTNVRLRGVTNIDAGESSGILLFIYTADALQRDFIDSEEGTLEWVPLDRVLEFDLVEDLVLLIPRLFGDSPTAEPFAAHVSYSDNDEMIFRFSDHP